MLGCDANGIKTLSAVNIKMQSCKVGLAVSCRSVKSDTVKRNQKSEICACQLKS